MILPTQNREMFVMQSTCALQCCYSSCFSKECEVEWERELCGQAEGGDCKEVAQGGKKQHSSMKESTVRGKRRKRGERTAGEEG